MYLANLDAPTIAAINLRRIAMEERAKRIVNRMSMEGAEGFLRNEANINAYLLELEEKAHAEYECYVETRPGAFRPSIVPRSYLEIWIDIGIKKYFLSKMQFHCRQKMMPFYSC